MKLCTGGHTCILLYVSVSTFCVLFIKQYFSYFDFSWLLLALLVHLQLSRKKMSCSSQDVCRYFAGVEVCLDTVRQIELLFFRLLASSISKLAFIFFRNQFSFENSTGAASKCSPWPPAGKLFLCILLHLGIVLSQNFHKHVSKADTRDPYWPSRPPHFGKRRNNTLLILQTYDLNDQFFIDL